MTRRGGNVVVWQEGGELIRVEMELGPGEGEIKIINISKTQNGNGINGKEEGRIYYEV